MTSKKEFNRMKADIQKLNDENDVLTSKIKSGHTELLKINNELKEKNEVLKKIMNDYHRQSIVIKETDKTKNELIQIKEEIKKYNDELDNAKTKTNNSIEVQKARNEKSELEDEIIKKRKEVESAIKELKFIESEMSKIGNYKQTEVIANNQSNTNIVDAASAVVSSLNKKLQITQKELEMVKKNLDVIRKQKSKTT